MALRIHRMSIGSQSIPWSLACFLATCGTLLAEPQLVIISPHWEGARIEFGRAFHEWHKAKYGEPVHIDWREVGGTSDIIRFIRSEFTQRPDGIGIDMLFGGGTDPYIELQKYGVLDEYRPPADILDKVPVSIGGVPMYDPQFRWFGVVLTTFGIEKNKRVAEIMKLPEANAWADLVNPKLRGWVGSGDPRNSGSVHMMYEIMLQGYGWEKGWDLMTQIAGNVRQYNKASSDTAKDGTLGETAYALAIDFYALTQVAGAGPANMGFVLPRDLTVVNADCICMLKGAPNKAAAQHFIDFMLSEDGQKLWMLPRGHPGGARDFSIERMCILPELYERYKEVTLVKTNPFALPVSFQYDPEKGGTRWNILNALIGSTLIDVHQELTAAWRSLIRRGMPADGLKEFCGTPLTEEAAITMAKDKWKDAKFRNRQQIEWQKWATRKFETIAHEQK
ncbi:MAG: extracellular solute-binding protein [Verrucomicrobiae bacterium]|nr:extracellular solute-binding protein [Verrucomicrobiae bacterium]